MLVAALLLAGLALPGAAAQAAQGRAKQLPKCATVTETGACRVRLFFDEPELGGTPWGDESVFLPRQPVGPPRVVNSQPSDSVVARAVLVLRNPTVTVQRDGEEAMEVSPKRFAKQWAATYGQSVPNPSRGPNGADAGARDQELPGVNLDLSKWDTYKLRATLREETYKKSKKTGTEKLRCEFDMFDALWDDWSSGITRPGDLVGPQDNVGSRTPEPDRTYQFQMSQSVHDRACRIEFRTPCDDDELD